MNVPRGNAGTYLPNIPQSEIREGDVIIFKFGKVWHVGVTIGFGETEVNPFDPTAQVPKIIVAQTNKVPCTPTTEKISWFDDHIIGVYRPV